MDYILSPKDTLDSCFFCLPENHLGPLPDRLVLYSDPTALIIMNLYPYNNGHLMTAPRRHVATLAQATRQEREAVINLAAWATEILQRFMAPHGFNLGINQGLVAGAGIADHLHFHITPRFQGDTNYMTVLGETRVIPEHIKATFDQLVGLFNC
jgi:ATP adenylyltransferase